MRKYRILLLNIFLLLTNSINAIIITFIIFLGGSEHSFTQKIFLHQYQLILILVSFIPINSKHIIFTYIYFWALINYSLSALYLFVVVLIFIFSGFSPTILIVIVPFLMTLVMAYLYFNLFKSKL